MTRLSGSRLLHVRWAISIEAANLALLRTEGGSNLAGHRRVSGLSGGSSGFFYDSGEGLGRALEVPVRPRRSLLTRAVP